MIKRLLPSALTLILALITTGIILATTPGFMLPGSLPEPDKLNATLNQIEKSGQSPLGKYSHLPDLSTLSDDSIVLAAPRTNKTRTWQPIKYSELNDNDVEFFYQGTLLALPYGPSGAIIAKPEISLKDIYQAYKAYDKNNWRYPSLDDVVYVTKSKNFKPQERQHYKLKSVKSNSRFIFQGIEYVITQDKENPDFEAIYQTNNVVSIVTDTHSSIHKDDIIDLQVRFKSGEQSSITGSYNHPFYVHDINDYMQMGELQPGMKLQTSDDSEAWVVEVEHKAGTVEMLNLSVANQNNFFVSTSNTGEPGLLVHNTGPKDTSSCEIFTDKENSAHNSANAAKHAELLKVTEMANPLVESLRKTGNLPSNFVTKSEAIQQGWRPGKALGNSIPEGQIGGDIFHNTTNVLPSSANRIWYEADVGINNAMTRAKQPGTRLLYSNDGLLYVTTDHYDTVNSISRWKK